MDAAEFETRYAARSGVTVGWLHANGRYAEPCECGEPECEGWQMGHQQEDAIVEDAVRTEVDRALGDLGNWKPTGLLNVPGVTSEADRG